ncbi:hypothetical protein YC2023_027462 [Brassica napus]
MMDWVLSLIITISLALPFTGRCSHVYTRSDFPEDFAFGSGTSAYQVRPFASFLYTRILILFEEAIEMLALVVVFESGKVLLQRTGESLASGILSSTLVT